MKDFMVLQDCFGTNYMKVLGRQTGLAGLFILMMLAGFTGYTQKKQPPATGAGSTGVHALTEHPRLFFTRGEEAAVLKKAASNGLLSSIIEVLKKEADKELNSTPQKFVPGKELLSESRTEIDRILTLAMAYRLFKDEKYARKTEEELLNVCQFASWNPKHFLDVAEMTTAVAIGYDWCYHYLSPSTRKAVEDAIREKAFAAAWPIYEDTGKTPFNRENNWNMVCNSGMLNGALAIGDKYPAELQRILDYAVRYTPHLLESFAPEGVFNEGPGYWSYNAMYMTLFFDNLDRNIHNDFGLPAYKGIDNTARFYMNIIGPSETVFNFGDAPAHIDYSAGTFLFLSKKYHDNQVSQFSSDLIKSAISQYNKDGDFELPRFFFLCIPWFNEAGITTAAPPKKLEIFNGVTDFIIINGNNPKDSNRLYLAAKTGRPNWSHNHLDVGSFVVDCQKERWAIDIGAETYNLPGFWDYKPGGTRWTYFRNNNLAHNTLSIDGKIAYSAGQGELLKANQDAKKPFGIFDITSAYEGQATSVLRGFKLVSPNLILIRDEVVPLRTAKKVSWKFFTKAAVAINGNIATLSQNGKKFYISCLLPAGYTMRVKEATVNAAEQKPLEGVRFIEIEADASGGAVAIPVLMGNNAAAFKDGAADNVILSRWN